MQITLTASEVQLIKFIAQDAVIGRWVDAEHLEYAEVAKRLLARINQIQHPMRHRPKDSAA